jgi:hypothetical protein
MAKGKIFERYKMLSLEDQRTFDRWLQANAVAGLILAAGLVAMALAGSGLEGPRDAMVADGSRAADAVAPERSSTRSGSSFAPKPMIPDRPF